MIIDGESHKITAEKIRQGTKGQTPEKIVGYYVEVEGKEFPPTQLIGFVTNTRPQSRNARSALRKLGFTVYTKC